VEFAEYQRTARETDQRSGTDVADLAVHLLGMVGEAGSVATEYKKILRDGPGHVAWKARMREELGDVLWYVASLASHLDLDLDDVARANLEKTADRWSRSSQDPFDDVFPLEERLPRHAVIEFVPSGTRRRPAARMRWEGRWLGDELTDAAHVADGYRFHDALHLAHAAVLGWSPVARKLMGRKRRSDPRIDEAEDGGRAMVIEEGIAALVFAYASSHDYLRTVQRLDYQLLDTIRGLVAPLEVSARSAADWERAIFAGYRAWDQLVAANGGTVTLDLDKQTIGVEAPTS
jgi:NTP pyrophosphatase (non-canonical NTP hydrolase)